MNFGNSLNPVRGIRLASCASGVAKHGGDDLTYIEIAKGSAVAAVFTRNALCAAPVVIARRHLERGVPILGLLINTGSANAATGEQGMADAQRCLRALADATGQQPENLLPFSTGVIGERMRVDNITQALPGLVKDVTDGGWGRASGAIKTTDTVAKTAACDLLIDGTRYQVTGIAKGAGMIRPDMATMLAFVACDAPIASGDLQLMLESAVSVSFNRISVDGDTSTNDACVLIATGQAGANAPNATEPGAATQNSNTIVAGAEGYSEVQRAITGVCQSLAKQIVRDGEGATKFISIEVDGALSGDEARQVAYTIAHSPLVKTACHAEDPNWGRILAAVGRSGLKSLDIAGISIRLDTVWIVRDGEPAPDYREAEAAAVMQRDAFSIGVSLGRGDASDEVWTCDLSAEYVRINADYRS